MEWPDKEVWDALQKWANFLTSFVPCENSIRNNVGKVYIYKKVMILTLHQYKTDFAHKNWVNMGVDSKNDVFGRILHLFVMPLHIYDISIK